MISDFLFQFEKSIDIKNDGKKDGKCSVEGFIGDIIMTIIDPFSQFIEK